MKKRKGQGTAFVGTSGWHYPHWLGRFYPATIKDDEQLAYYVHHFDSVEINNSFYKLPSATTFMAWKKTAPSSFVFAVKASRYITHMKKLKMGGDALKPFFSGVTVLGKKLGPILFQLPPGWKVNVDRLKTFLEALPKGFRFAFEFRNPTWFTDDVYHLLRQHRCAFCVYELAGHTSPVEVTADFVYIRLHGPGAKYEGNYSAATLRKWAVKVRKWLSESLDVYVFFDNDQLGYAAGNAAKLKTLLSR